MGVVLAFSAAVSVWAAPAPAVSAEATILAEVGQDGWRVLDEKNSRERMYPASITKILTALVALEYLDPDEIVVVGPEINDISLDSSKAGHIRGESISVLNLMRGLLITSGNDTANVVAVAAARKANGETGATTDQLEQQFVDLMNAKAAELGCTDTHFVNAHGYHDPNHYTTAYDLALIVREALQVELIREIARETNFSGNGLSGINMDTTGLTVQDYEWKSHNSLIMPGSVGYYEYANGMKTGYTDEAGSCVAATAQKDGVDLIAIVLKDGDTARWADAAALFEYGFNEYGNQTVQTKGQVLGTAALTGHDRNQGDTLELVAAGDATLYLNEEEVDRLETSFALDNALVETLEDGTEALKAPLAEGQQVGTISYALDGAVWLTVPVCAARAVEKQTPWTSLKYFLTHTLFTGKVGLIVLIVVAVVVVLILVLRVLPGRRRGRRFSYSSRPRGRKLRFGKRRRW